MLESERLSPALCESSSRRHPAYGTTQGLTIHCVELDTCWAVPVAAACITFLSCIVSSSYGYLYVLLIKELHVKREESALPQTAFVISGGCVATLVDGFIASAGVLASSFAPNRLTVGDFRGDTRSWRGNYTSGVTRYLLLYFDKYKATATAIKDIGHGRSRLFPFMVAVQLQVISNYTNSLFMTTVGDYTADKGLEAERAKSILMFTFLG
ncbi:hypothetical protein MRX96_032093 [Rhipicephalus microplus]